MNKNTVNQEILDAFGFAKDFKSLRSYGSGHINDTYLLETAVSSGKNKFILQHINKNIFKRPPELMENITGVTGWLRKKIIEANGDPDRETLNVCLTTDGKPFFLDSYGEYWRVYDFIDHTICYDQIDSAGKFHQTAVAFGHFQRLLADYPAKTLHETIPHFHDTPVRYAAFEKTAAEDLMGRAGHVREEIAFVTSRKDYVHTLTDKEKSGELPLRVTHNDTKLNNILIDSETGKAICIIDLDTVMPGISVNDFGDSIRFGASTAAEDETDLTKVSCDLALFEAYTRGFLKGCAGTLTSSEIDCLIDGAIMMTLECGMRFLADHLEGDHYFKIHRENHNLDRARTQFKLVHDMENKRGQLDAIVKRAASELQR